MHHLGRECPYNGATTASALALRAAAGHLACLSGVDQWEAVRNLIQIIPAQLLFRLSFTGGKVCACMVIWWLLLASRNQCCGERRSQQLCLLCDVACAALVARALVTLPLQAWSLLRYSLHLSWAIVPYSGAIIFLRRYCTSQPQFASRELQIVRDPTRRNVACSSHSRDKAVQCPQVVVS